MDTSQGDVSQEGEVWLVFGWHQVQLDPLPELKHKKKCVLGKCSFFMSENRISLNVKTKGNRSYEDVSASIILSIVSILSHLLSQLLLSLFFIPRHGTPSVKTINRHHFQLTWMPLSEATPM